MNRIDLTLRPATTVDAHRLLDWRNESATRRNSRNNEPIGFEQHEAWLSRVLASSDHVIWIAEANGAPVEVLRADRIARGWELSWTVAPEARGRGYGGHMLRCFVASLNGCLTAIIRKDNLASMKIAAGAGLKRKGDALEPDFELWMRE